jgi:hypothetical protein
MILFDVSDFEVGRLDERSSRRLPGYSLLFCLACDDIMDGCSIWSGNNGLVLLCVFSGRANFLD